MGLPEVGQAARRRAERGPDLERAGVTLDSLLSSALDGPGKSDSRGGDGQNDRAPAYLFPEPSATVQWKLREPGSPESRG